MLQARAVIDGLPADLVALALPLDVQKIADAGMLRADWRKQYPLESVGACLCLPGTTAKRAHNLWAACVCLSRCSF